jgi:glycosyltransferase involved in cell wall biosynthesis
MKVLLVSQEFPPHTSWGGIGTYAGIVAPALVRAGAEVHVLSVVRGQSRGHTRRPDGVSVHRVPLTGLRGPGRLTGMPHTWSRIHLARAVAREFRRLRLDPDVIECPEWRAEGFVLARTRPAPLVVRSHSSAAQVLPFVGARGYDLRAAAWMEDDALRRADVVTGPASQLDAEAHRAGLARERLAPIPYPVVAREARPEAPGPPTLCFVGRFERRKGPDTLVRALPAVRAAVPDVRVVMIGRDMGDADHPSFVAHLRALATRLGVTDALDLRDRWAPPEEVAAAMGAATVCVAPSRWESFGLVAGEAAALGRAVVASDIPGLRDAVVDGESGRLLPPDDVEAWAGALVELLTDPAQAAAMGRAGAAHIERQCHPDRVAELTLAAYEAAIGRGREAA